MIGHDPFDWLMYAVAAVAAGLLILGLIGLCYCVGYTVLVLFP